MKEVFRFAGKHFIYTFIAIAVIFTVFASSVYGFVKVAGSSSADISIPEVKEVVGDVNMITPKPTVEPIVKQIVQPTQVSIQEPTVVPVNSGSQNKTRESEKRDSSYEVKTSSGAKFSEDKDLENVREDEKKSYEDNKK